MADNFWDIAVVEQGRSVGQHSSLAILPSGQPAISYYDYIGRDLKYAWFDGATWHTSTVPDPDDDVGTWCSLAILPSGYPAISYHGESPDQSLKYAEYDGATWHIATLDDAGDGGWYTSLAILPADHPAFPGQPVISYHVGTGYWDLKFAWRDNGGAWHVATVDSLDHVGTHTSVAILPSGQPAISYYTWTSGRLKYAWHTLDFDFFKNWSHAVVDGNDADVGRWNSLAILPSGKPAISYRDDSNLVLKYAELVGDDPADPADWRIDVVDDDGDVGVFTSLTTLPTDGARTYGFDQSRSDLSGQPIISYRDWSNYALKFAWFNGSEWRNVTADNFDNAGSYTSLAILPESGQRPSATLHQAPGVT